MSKDRKKYCSKNIAQNVKVSASSNANISGILHHWNKHHRTRQPEFEYRFLPGGLQPAAWCLGLNPAAIFRQPRSHVLIFHATSACCCACIHVYIFSMHGTVWENHPFRSVIPSVFFPVTASKKELQSSRKISTTIHYRSRIVPVENVILLLLIVTNHLLRACPVPLFSLSIENS